MVQLYYITDNQQFRYNKPRYCLCLYKNFNSSHCVSLLLTDNITYIENVSENNHSTHSKIHVSGRNWTYSLINKNHLCGKVSENGIRLMRHQTMSLSCAAVPCASSSLFPPASALYLVPFICTPEGPIRVQLTQEKNWDSQRLGQICGQVEFGFARLRGTGLLFSSSSKWTRLPHQVRRLPTYYPNFNSNFSCLFRNDTICAAHAYFILYGCTADVELGSPVRGSQK